MTDSTIGFIGGGNMAASIIGGLVPDQINADHICVFDPNPDTCQRLAIDYKISICSNNEELLSRSDIIVLAVKPQVMQAVLQPLASIAQAQRPLFISIAAGIPCAHMNAWLDTGSNEEHAIVRVMPNTPALVKAGASGLYANQHVSEHQRLQAQNLMQAVGSAAWVPEEANIDAVTALSGSGPAYFMLFVKSLTEAGVNAGLTADVARQLAIDTCAGSASLMASSEHDIQQLIDNVTSPGGTTEQALLSFKAQELPRVVETAFNAALKRSEELAEELG
ncbi:MAG: pyrroline-5-carboxylate reductase [Arenicella sp.]